MTNYRKSTIDQAKFIAATCNSCGRCLQQCVFLQQQNQTPAKLFEAFVEKGDIEPLVPYSCQLCHQCTVVCPHHLELADAFLAIRQDMVTANKGRAPLKQFKSVALHQLMSRFALFCYTRKG